MTVNRDTRSVVEDYFRAWTSKRTDEAFELLAHDLKFAGPTASYSSAEQFRPALDGFAVMTKTARIVELMTEGDRAAMLYECELPVGTLRIASFFRVTNGKIVWYETQFDATELRKILVRKPEAEER